jgi:hypothetical protein
MTDLSENLLQAAREGLSPDAAAMARVRAKVAASVAATGAAATGSAVAIPAKAATGLGIKLGIGVLGAVVLAALGGAIVASRSHRATEPARIAIATHDTDETPESVRVATTEPRMVAPATSPATTQTRPTRTQAAKSIPAPAVAAVAHAPEPVSLAREVELIDKAMLLVRRGDARDAIGVIATFERETRGAGQMAEDASAIEIEARCRLHEDAGAQLSAFDRRWPSSAQRSRLQTICFARTQSR